MRSRISRLLWAAVLLLPLLAFGVEPVLEYRVKGLDRELHKNVVAWLGPAPTSVSDRAAFVVGARDKVSNGLQALGYFSPVIDIDLDRNASPWKLRIKVSPGEPVTVTRLDIQISGDARQDEAFAELIKTSPIKKGDVLHQGHYESLKSSLYTLAHKRGYFDGKYDESQVQVDVSQRQAVIVLRFDSGIRYRFGPLRQSQTHVFAERLLPLQPFAEGDPFLLSKLQEFQAELQRTGYFNGVLIQPRINEAVNGEVPLDLELFPAVSQSVELGLGYSTDTKERVSVVWRTPLINRYGHSQETRIEYSKVNPSGRFTYKIPLSHPLDDVLQLWGRLEQNEFGDVSSDQSEVGARREIRHEHWITGYSLRFLYEGWNVIGYDEKNQYLLPGISFARKSREGPLINPDRGLSQYYELEGASKQLSSDVNLLRAYTQLIYVTTLPDPVHRLVARVEAGAAWLPDSELDQLAPSLGFFAGGSQSVRGYGYQTIGRQLNVSKNGEEQRITVGGDRLLAGSIEYQYSFRPNWRAALFVDAGDAFDQGNFDAKIGVGTGLQYITPVGAVTFDVARGMSGDNPSWHVYLNIGAEF